MIDVDKIQKDAARTALRCAIEVEANRLADLAQKDHVVLLDLQRSISYLECLANALFPVTAETPK